MNKCMSCLRGAGHAAFLTRREPLRLPPSLAPAPSPHCFRTVAERIRPRSPPELQPISSSPHLRFFFFFFWRKSIVCMCPMKGKRRDVISCCDLEGAESLLKAGECEAALRGRVILIAHPTPRPPRWCELTEVLPYLSHSLRNLRLQSFPLNSLKKMPFWGWIRS